MSVGPKAHSIKAKYHNRPRLKSRNGWISKQDEEEQSQQNKDMSNARSGSNRSRVVSSHLPTKLLPYMEPARPGKKASKAKNRSRPTKEGLPKLSARTHTEESHNQVAKKMPSGENEKIVRSRSKSRGTVSSTRNSNHRKLDDSVDIDENSVSDAQILRPNSSPIQSPSKTERQPIAISTRRVSNIKPSIAPESEKIKSHTDNDLSASESHEESYELDDAQSVSTEGKHPGLATRRRERKVALRNLNQHLKQNREFIDEVLEGMKEKRSMRKISGHGETENQTEAKQSDHSDHGDHANISSRTMRGLTEDGYEGDGDERENISEQAPNMNVLSETSFASHVVDESTNGTKNSGQENSKIQISIPIKPQRHPSALLARKINKRSK